MRSVLRRLLVTLATTSGLAACAGDVVAPASQPVAPQLKVTVNRMAADSTSADFTVTQSGGTFQIGPHAIYFPSGSICDPATSGYGVTLWDAPCQKLTKPIAIHAEVRKVNGQAFVDFSPELRFVPSRSSDKWVWIWMRSPAAMNADSLKKSFNILWAPAPGAEPIDESLTDPTLQTGVLPEQGLVYRRIKHFSGYIVSVGFKTDDTTISTDGLVPGLF